ncbi:MAG: division/cell wall cluster transcriptional repressor MraZ [bacterium]
MAEFTGQYLHMLDPKGRLTLPSPFRDRLAGEPRAMLALRPNHCLAIYPGAEWEALLARLKTLPGTDQQALGFKRVLLATAYPCELDKQGRIVVPPPLRALASITRDVTVVGAQEIVEIWDRTKWDEYLRMMLDLYDENAAKLQL